MSISALTSIENPKTPKGYLTLDFVKHLWIKLKEVFSKVDTISTTVNTLNNTVSSSVVDLTTEQTIAGNKTFSNEVTLSSVIRQDTNSIYLNNNVNYNITAGTTQTQEGATHITNSINFVTTANANDGVALGYIGGGLGNIYTIVNKSGVTIKVYPSYHSGNPVDGIDGNDATTPITMANGVTKNFIIVAANTWLSY